MSLVVSTRDECSRAFSSKQHTYLYVLVYVTNTALEFSIQLDNLLRVVHQVLVEEDTAV